MSDPIKGLNQLIRMYEKHVIVEMRCTKAINYINQLQAENASLKAERDKLQAVVDGLPSYEQILNLVFEKYNDIECRSFCQDIAKAIHKLIHKGE